MFVIHLKFLKIILKGLKCLIPFKIFLTFLENFRKIRKFDLSPRSINNSFTDVEVLKRISKFLKPSIRRLQKANFRRQNCSCENFRIQKPISKVLKLSQWNKKKSK